jgi:hypothetical protein
MPATSAGMTAKGGDSHLTGMRSSRSDVNENDLFRRRSIALEKNGAVSVVDRGSSLIKVLR